MIHRSSLRWVAVLFVAMCALAATAAVAHAAPANVLTRSASASVTAASPTDGCQNWKPATGEHFTSNHLLSVYVQSQYCHQWTHFKVVVRNYSPNGVGNRAYGWGTSDYNCLLKQDFPTVSYIPPYGTWVSATITLTVDDVINGNGYFTGIIYRPRDTEFYMFEVKTGCVEF